MNDLKAGDFVKLNVETKFKIGKREFSFPVGVIGRIDHILRPDHGLLVTDSFSIFVDACEVDFVSSSSVPGLTEENL